MEQQDLQQIKETVKETIKEDVRDAVREETRGIVREEVKGMGEKIDGLDNKVKGMGEKIDGLDNKVKGMGEKIDEVLTTSKAQFDEHTKKLDDIEEEIKKRPTKAEFSSWRDKQVEPVERDVEKLKYIHREKWKSLPYSGEVSRVLVDEGLKN